jgi:ubiquinone/menaquinone biosynthesis C-methylase UbiE
MIASRWRGNQTQFTLPSERTIVSENNLEGIRAQFTRQAQAYADSAQARDNAAHERLVELCAPPAGARVLDVACGPGFLTLAFAARCAEAVGVDATDALLALGRAEAQRRGATNVRFDRGDATALPFSEGSFDVVSCRAAFHHFPEPDRVLAEMARAVRRGGKVVTADFVTSENPAESKAHNEIERLCDPTHVRALTGSEFRALFLQNGLKITADFPRRMHYELDEWILHGGPAPEVEAEIRRRFDQALERDGTGLNIRREEGKIRFTHQTLVLIGVRSAG